MLSNYFKGMEAKKRFAIVFGILGLIATFRLNSFGLFIGLTSFSALIGYLIGKARVDLKKKRHRYPAYMILFLLLLIPMLALFYTQYQSCLAYYPYEAKNIFTGETKRFIHGGCGARTEHPWYYRITDKNAGSFFTNQTS